MHRTGLIALFWILGCGGLVEYPVGSPPPDGWPYDEPAARVKMFTADTPTGERQTMGYYRFDTEEQAQIAGESLGSALEAKGWTRMPEVAESTYMGSGTGFTLEGQGAIIWCCAEDNELTLTWTQPGK